MMEANTSGDALSYRDELVLDEVKAIREYHPGHLTWIRAYHVRYFRGDRTPDEIRGLTLAQIQNTLRQLDRKGYLHRRGRHAEYRPKVADDE